MKPGLREDQYAAVFHDVIGYNLQPQVVHLVDEGSCVSEENAGVRL